MANPHEWGRWLKIFRDRTGQSQDDLVDSINGFYDALSDAERAALIGLNLEAYFTMSKTGLSEAENGKRPPQTRDRVVLMIYYFSRAEAVSADTIVIKPEEADNWLRMMDWIELRDEEPNFIFGQKARVSRPTRLYHEYQIDIPTKEEPGSGIPVVAVPPGASDLVLSPIETDGRLRLRVGFIIPALSLLLLLIAAWLFAHPATVKRLKDWFLLPTATPGQEAPTPNATRQPPTLLPGVTASMTSGATATPNATQHYQQGLAHVKQQQREAAVADFSQAIAQNPDYAEAYFSRGITFGGLGKRDEAMADFTEVIRLRPTDHLAYYQRGLLYQLSNESENALTDFNQAIALQRNFALAFRDRGLLYQRLHHLPEALTDLHRYLELKPAAEDERSVQQRIAEIEAALQKEK